MSIELCSIGDHTYKYWVIYQSEKYQIDRLEIHRWGNLTNDIPTLVRGYRVLQINEGKYYYCHCQEADNLIHTLSYFNSKDEQTETYDDYIGNGVQSSGFKELQQQKESLSVVH
jgi:hypothetical protein